MASMTAVEIAREYERRGGKRLAKMDDNLIGTRLWEDEPAEASAFWNENVEGLSDKEQAEIVSNLKKVHQTKVQFGRVPVDYQAKLTVVKPSS
jgi:hypothetical protein